MHSTHESGVNLYVNVATCGLVPHGPGLRSSAALAALREFITDVA